MATQRDRKGTSRAAHTRASKRTRGPRYCAGEPEAHGTARPAAAVPGRHPTALAHGGGDGCDRGDGCNRAGQNGGQFLNAVTMQITAESS